MNDENMQDAPSPLFGQYTTPIVALVTFGFLAWFFASQWDGVWALFVWLGNGLADAPNALGRVATHYSTTPPLQWLASIVIGAGFGAILTPRFTSKLSRRAVAMGALTGGFGSQLLILPTQHCTYTPETPFVQVALGVFLTLVGAGVFLLPLWTWLSGGIKREGTSGFFKSNSLPYLFLLPMVLNLLLFLYYPSIQTVSLSLFSRRFPLPQERFVCLGNYVTLAEDVIYQNSFITTFFLMFLIVVISLALALGIALLASQKVRYASVYRTLLIWPFALSPVVAGAIFLAMFREGQTGLINAFINALTGNTLSWLRDANLARVAVVAASVWNILGFNVLFYIAGLQNVPKDLLEAASIDGANRVQRFFRITFPMLAPFTFFLLVTNVTFAFYGIYGVVDTLTRGGPPLGAAGSLGGATGVLIYKLYEDAFRPGAPIGLAAAQAVILFILVASLTVLQFRTLESRITYSD